MPTSAIAANRMAPQGSLSSRSLCRDRAGRGDSAGSQLLLWKCLEDATLQRRDFRLGVA